MPQSRIDNFDAMFERVAIVPNLDSEHVIDFQALVGHGAFALLRRHLRVTSAGGRRPIVCEEEQTLDTKVCNMSCFISNGVTIQQVHVAGKRVYEMLTTTVDDGFHRFSQYARLDDTGRLQSLGVYNAFGLNTHLYQTQADVDDALAAFAEMHDEQPAAFWDEHVRV